MKKNNLIYIFLFVAFNIAFSSCGGSITNVSNPPSITSATKMLSSTLATNSSAELVNRFLDANLSTDCADNASYCLTPFNVSGKIYYSGIMVGDYAGYSLGPIVGDVVDPSTITEFPSADLNNFDFSEELTLDGSFSCCEGSPYPEDNDAIATHIESYFAYIDISFTLSNADGVDENLFGTHTVRTVYGDIENSDYQQGDLLYEYEEDDFRWCTLTEGCVFTERPEDPIQYEDVVDYDGSPDDLGNQTIPVFSVTLDEESQIYLTEDEVKNNDWAFTIDFQMGKGVVFTDDITSVTSVAEMIEIFQLSAEPGNEDNGFTASLTAEPL